MIGLNSNGIVKIWSNANLAKNFPSEHSQINITSKPMIKSIVELVSGFVRKDSFRELTERIGKIGNLSFYKLKFCFDEYVNEKGIELNGNIGKKILERGYKLSDSH